MWLIPLRAYRFVPRKPWLRVDGDALVFRVPGWFGGRTWAVPLSAVGVVDLALVPETAVDDEAVFEEPVVVPYLFTTGAATQPNVGLVFAEPVRLPPFRLLVRLRASEIAPRRSARGDRPAGRYVDGLLLRAVDPATAVEGLAAAGAERVTDPDAWIADRRVRVTDPAAVKAIEAKDRRWLWLWRGAAAVSLGGVAAVAAGDLWFGDTLMAVGFGATIGGLVVQQATATLARWTWFRPRDVRRRRPRAGAPGG